MRIELAASPNSLPALWAALEAAGAKPTSRRQFVTSAYYDTPDLSLRRQHLSLCLQKRGARHSQILTDLSRAEDAAGEGEWRDRIPGNTPDLTAPHTGPHLQAVAGENLRLVFTTLARRTALRVSPDNGGEIIGTFDDGEIRAAEGGVAEPDCRLTLELRQGAPATLRDMVLALLDAVPLRIAAQSRLERGYQLSGVVPAAVTAAPLALRPSMTVEMVLQRSGRECVNHLLDNEPAAMVADSAAFHQMRVAARRLRSLLAAVRSMLPADQYQWMMAELRWFAESLGPARAWDVFAVDLLAPIQAILKAEADLENLAEVIKQRRRIACDDAKEVVGSERYAKAVLTMVLWFETCDWRDQAVSENSAPLFSGIAETAPFLIERRWHQAMKRSKHFVGSSQGQRHRFRIALKKLRYTIEFLESLFDAPSVKLLTKRLKRLQEDLGHLNDVRTAQELIRELARPADHNGDSIGQVAGVIIGWHLRDLIDREVKLRKDVRRFRKVKPFWQSVLSTPVARAA